MGVKSEYGDDGCLQHDRCFTCPFNECIVSDTGRDLKPKLADYPDMNSYKAADMRYRRAKKLHEEMRCAGVTERGKL